MTSSISRSRTGSLAPLKRGSISVPQPAKTELSPEMREFALGLIRQAQTYYPVLSALRDIAAKSAFGTDCYPIVVRAAKMSAEASDEELQLLVNNFLAVCGAFRALQSRAEGTYSKCQL